MPMSVTFRPIPKLSVAAALMFAALMALGIWQIQRLHWKLNLIAMVNHRLTAAPISLDDALALGTARARYRKVALTGRFDNAHEAFVFKTGPDGKPVYHVLTPFVMASGKAIIVDRGYIPLTLKNRALRQAGELTGMRRIVGIWREPDSPGWFTPAPDLKGRVWYAREVTAIAKADGVTLAAPVVVEADATPNPSGWPRGGQTVVHFRNEHLQYAITWFALAAGLVLVYLTYHRSVGRLGFRP